MRLRLAALSLAVSVVVPRVSNATDLTLDAQVAASIREVAGGTSYWSVWSRRDDGKLGLLSFDNSSPEDWLVYEATTSVGAKGVAATSYDLGAGLYDERVCYVGANGNFFMRYTKGAGGLIEVSPPSGQTLTGHVAAAYTKTVGPGAATRVFCFATTNQGRLYAYQRNVSSNPETGVWLNLQSSISTTQGITASSSPNLAYARVFAVTTSPADRVWMERYEASTGKWADGRLDDSLFTTAVCGTMAAAEGDLDAGAYRIYLACTRKDAQNRFLYIAWSNSVNEAEPADGTWNWQWITTIDLDAGVGDIKNSDFAIAMRTRPNGSYVNFDAYVLNTSTPVRLFRTTRTNLAAWTDHLVDLGSDPEASAHSPDDDASGGLVATLDASSASRVFFLEDAGGGGRPTRMFSRTGEGASSNPANWWNHQSGDPRHLVTATPHAESVIAHWDGLAAAAAIGFFDGPDADTIADDDSAAEILWSTDGGDTWSAPVTLPDVDCDGNGQPEGWDRVNDPVVDFSENGTAWIAALGACDANASCTAAPGPNDNICGGTRLARAYYMSTTNGTTFQNITCLANGASGFDHPWLRVEHVAGPDVLHFVYVNDWDAGANPGTDVVYFTQVPGGASSTTLLDVPAPGGAEPTAGHPYIDLAAGHTPQVAWFGGEAGGLGDVYVCEVTGGAVPCDSGLGPQLLSGLDITKIAYDQNSTQNGSICTLDNSSGWEMAASPSNAHRIYYVANVLETDGGAGSCTPTGNPCVCAGCPGGTNPAVGDGPDIDCLQEKDILFTVLTFTPGVGWTASPPVILGNDDADELVPTVTVHARSATQDRVFVSWYDRSYNCPDGTVNSCFRARGAWSDDGVTFHDEREIDAGLSDSRLLIQPCQIANGGTATKVWFGDYHHAIGEALHTGEMFTTAPTAGGGSPGSGHLEEAWESRGFTAW